MDNSSPYVPPKVWTPNSDPAGRFAKINRPVAGPTHTKELPVGRHPFQLYSLGTPNGVKVTVLLEELLEAGHAGAEYDAWLINISEGQQFSTGFTEINPNSKIPALVDHSGSTPVRIFESGAIMMHLAEKFSAFLPADSAARAECLSWLFWQVGSAPFLGGGFGHFYAYAPTKLNTRSTAMRWKLNGKWMSLIDDWQKVNSLLVIPIRLPIWRSGRGTAQWPKVSYTKRVSFCKSMNIPMYCDGQMRLHNAQRSSGGVW